MGGDGASEAGEMSEASEAGEASGVSETIEARRWRCRSDALNFTTDYRPAPMRTGARAAGARRSKRRRGDARG